MLACGRQQSQYAHRQDVLQLCHCWCYLGIGMRCVSEHQHRTMVPGERSRTHSHDWCFYIPVGTILMGKSLPLSETIANLLPFGLQGLVTIVVTGADLCTGSFMFTTISVLHRRLSVWKMLIHWTVTFFGNLAGSLFVVGLMTG
jgi:hypothetical protein